LPYDDEGMLEYAERWSPTDQEKLQRFGELIFNAGTYEVDGTRIKMRPMVAKDPDLIGGYIIFDYEWSGEKLILTWVDEYSSDGVQHPLIEQVGGQEHMTFSRLPDYGIVCYWPKGDNSLSAWLSAKSPIADTIKVGCNFPNDDRYVGATSTDGRNTLIKSFGWCSEV